MTAQGIPEGVQPPVVTPLSFSSLHVSWSEPGRPNGIIQRYHLNRTGVGTIVTHTDGVRSYTVTGRIQLVSFCPLSLTFSIPKLSLIFFFFGFFDLFFLISVSYTHTNTLTCSHKAEAHSDTVERRDQSLIKHKR